MTNQFFPFGQPFQNSAPANQAYDLEILKAYPGIELVGTEPNGVEVVFREVDGCGWWVINADYDQTNLYWSQVVPNNAANPAYALEQCADGTLNRLVTAATEVPGTPITWTQVWSIDPSGNITTNPLTATLATQIAQSLDPTWNSGADVQMTARQVSVTDQSSDADSYVDALIVNGTTVWAIRKDGTLVIGMIPYANITGAPTPPSFNNPTFTGTATFTGPAVFDDGINVSGAPAVITDGLQVTGGETVDTLTVTGNEVVDGNLNVDGTTTLNNLVVDGTITGAGAPIPVSITSPDGSIVVTNPSTNDFTVEQRSGGTIPPSYGVSYSTAQNYPIGETTGTLSLPTLPGNSAVTYTVIISGSLELQDGSHTLTWTGTTATGVTWPNSPQAYKNGSGATFPFTFYGTAEGGTAPTATWTTDDMLGYTPMTATIVAYVNP
jgi:hypothetical protein